MNLEKLDLQSPDLVLDNIEKIAAIFPNCVTEGLKGREIDFDLLKQELNHSVIEGTKERYRLEWPGKKEAIVVANIPTTKTLRPVRKESVDFDNTENIYIEGDNLEVLKLLQESYLGKIKMIYIDPPYNTGKDFVYKDNYSKDSQSELFSSGQKDEYNNRLVVNPESNGRYHSDWLSMMYPRLKLARNLLTDDGIVFISIDDIEFHNLRKICDEIFGQDNFVCNFIWEKRTNRENRKTVSYRHDNILCYRKSAALEKALFQLPMNGKALSNYHNPDNDPRGLWKSDPATAQAGHGTKNQFYTLVAPNGKNHKLESGRCWLYTEKVMNQAILDNRIWFGKDGNGVPRVKTYLNDKERGLTPETIIFSKDGGTNETAKNSLKQMFEDKAVFDTPKPVELIKILTQTACKCGIVLDFFAGSSTSAHSILEINASSKSKISYIQIQIAEQLDPESEAFKYGFSNLCDLGKARIKKASKMIKKQLEDEIIAKKYHYQTLNEGQQSIDSLEKKNELETIIDNLEQSLLKMDFGFRVFRLDSSNMQDVYYKPQDLTQDDLALFADNIKPDRTSDDLLTQVMIDWGLQLSLKIEEINISGKKVYKVAGNSLYACFDNGIDESFAKVIAKDQPLRIVFRDSGFANDTAKINVKQLLKQLSPETEMKVI